MELAKSFFGPNSREGYVGKQQHKVHVETVASEDEEIGISTSVGSKVPAPPADSNQETDLLCSYEPVPGGPFSAVTPSMWPQEFLVNYKPDDTDFRIDEFGFNIDTETDENCKNSKLNDHFIEDSQCRLHWLAQLEFNQGDELTWENVNITLPRTDKLGEMVKKGIPHSLRSQLWMRFTGALAKKQSAEMNYREIVKSSNFDHLAYSQMIEKELLRTLPSNACFTSKNGTGVARLRRVLRALSWFFSDIGYCQAMGVIVAHLLLLMEEEDAFWMMVTIMEDVLPASYYINGFTGVLADIRVLRNLISTYLPGTDEVLLKYDVDITLIGLSWLLPVFAGILHVKLLLRIWDLLFFYGSISLFRTAIGFIKLAEDDIIHADCMVQVYTHLSNSPTLVDDIDQFIQMSFEVCANLNDSIIENYRRKHQAYIMVDRGTLIGNPDSATNLPKQHLSRSFHRTRNRIRVGIFRRILYLFFGCIIPRRYF